MVEDEAPGLPSFLTRAVPVPVASPEPADEEADAERTAIRRRRRRRGPADGVEPIPGAAVASDGDGDA
jgi:hypothetical protein